MTYIGYFMGIAGLVTFFSGRAERRAEERYNIAKVQTELQSVKNKMVTPERIVRAIDSVFTFRMIPYISKQQEIIATQNAQFESYRNYLHDQIDELPRPLTFKEFEKYMQSGSYKLEPVRNPDSLTIRWKQIIK